MSTPVRITGLVTEADPALVTAGWLRRTVTQAERAQELAHTYREIGFEVLIRPLDPSSYVDDCAGCAAGPAALVVYTRRGSDWTAAER